MDEFWKKVYDALMTPVPQPKGTELDKLFEFFRNTPNLPDVPELPVAPEWIKHYAKYAKDFPLASERASSIQVAPQQSGLWDALRASGTTPEAIHAGAARMLNSESDRPLRYHPSQY